MKKEVTMKIIGENLIEFTLEPTGFTAVAQLREFCDEYLEDHVIGNNAWHGKCPIDMKPQEGESIWAFTTSWSGYFWARDLQQIMGYLEKEAQGEVNEPFDGIF